MKKADTYKETKEFQFGNVTVCVYIPDLTDEERKRRERNIEIALQQCGRELYKTARKGAAS